MVRRIVFASLIVFLLVLVAPASASPVDSAEAFLGDIVQWCYDFMDQIPAILEWFERLIGVMGV